MNLLLILREEIVCLFILLYLLVNSLKFIREDKFFIRMNLYALGHVVFDIITILTVNNVERLPLWVNTVCHACFYVFAIACCSELFIYILNVSGGKYQDKITNLKRISRCVPIVYFLLIPFFKIEYLQGNGSRYSFGECVFVGYAIAMLFFLASEIWLLTHIRKVPDNVKKALIPGFVIMTIAIILQIFIPELLFTGADVTLVTVGVYFAIVNPVGKYRERAYFDREFDIKNRNAFYHEVEKLHGGKKERMTIVMFDMNGLKQINDNFGHQMGDKYIMAIAQTLKKQMATAFGVYRIGGDEFTAVYFDTVLSVVEQEIQNTIVALEKEDMKTGIPVSISFGIAEQKESEDFRDVERRADQVMFAYKRRYYEDKRHDRRHRE